MRSYCSSAVCASELQGAAILFLNAAFKILIDSTVINADIDLENKQNAHLLTNYQSSLHDSVNLIRKCGIRWKNTE